MRKSLIVATLILLPGCASITTGTTQDVLVETPRVTGAKCEFVDTEEGRWVLDSTPGTVTVGKGDGPLQVTCTKDGYETGRKVVAETFQPMTVGNVLIGGIVGIAVDAASGAIQEYPDTITVWMKPKNLSMEEEATWYRLKAAQEAQEPTTEPPEEQQTASLTNNARSSDSPPGKAGAPPPQQGDGRLSSDAIKDLFSGVEVAMGTYAFVFKSDGRFDGTYEPYAAGFGRWWVADGRHCVKWARWDYTYGVFDGAAYPPRPGCFAVDRTGGRYEFVSSGNPGEKLQFSVLRRVGG